MKRAIITGVILIASIATSHAQQKWTITPRVGINISDLSGGTGTESLTSKAGLTLGAEAEYRFIPLLGISAGAFYSQQGSKADQTLTVRDEYLSINTKIYNCKLNYINVPVLLNIHVWQGLTVKAGLQIGYLLSAKSKTRTWGYIAPPYYAYLEPDEWALHATTPTSLGAYIGSKAPEPTPDGVVDPDRIDITQNQNIKEGMHKVDLALPVGLSYEYKHFVIDARYHFGLTKIESGDPSDNLRNRYANITLGYRF